jgi:cytochrome c peroxidase
MRRILLGAALAAQLTLTACGDGHATPAPNPNTLPPTLSPAARIGAQAFVDQTLSGGRNMACSSCHSPQYAYGPPNSLSVQLGSDPSRAGLRAVPSLRYKDVTPAYADVAENPDGATMAAPGGGFMWDGRAATLADQAGMPLLNPLEMNSPSKAFVVAAVRNGAYADGFRKVFGANVFDNTDAAFADLGKAIAAYEHEDVSFHPYASKFDRFIHNKIGGRLSPAELRGMVVFNGATLGNCAACHYAGHNFDGGQGLMTDFTYQALGAPRNDDSIPGNPDPIPADNADRSYFDMGLCGPLRTDHAPADIGRRDPFCGKFKVPTLRNIATRGAFFHNGVFHSLNQVAHFYNTRDTHPEYWYPSSGGAGGALATPTWALQASVRPGASVARFNDLPPAQRGNVDEEVPMGSGETPPDHVSATMAADGVKPRAAGAAPAMTEQDIADLICFLGTLSDGYQPTDKDARPTRTPAGGNCAK